MNGLRSMVSGLMARGAPVALATAEAAPAATVDDPAPAAVVELAGQSPEAPAAAVEPTPAAAAEPAPAAEPEAVAPETDALRAEGFAAATARMKAVFASEQFAGREAHAAKLLANDKLSSDEIVALLADMPKAGENAALAALAADPNPDLGAGGEPEGARADNHGWGKAHAQINRTRARHAARK